jgi:O-acetyl-ADP-ribose deacetylase (regulator of RNase III)
MNHIEYRTGDLFAGSRNSIHTEPGTHILMHGCNAQGVMGSGVAKTFKEHYPAAFQDYVADLTTFREQDSGPLGCVSFHYISKRYILASAITQEFYGKDGRVYASYSAIFAAFTEIADNYLYDGSEVTVHIPLIGCGLGGLKWNKVAMIIQHCLACYTNLKVVVWEIE